MIKEDICCVILKAKICSANLAADYIDSITYGYNNDEEIWSKIEILGGLINILESYVPNPTIDINKIKLTNVGRFSLDVNGNSLSLNQNILTVKADLVNCLTTEEICEVFQKIFIICPNC